MDTSAPTAVLSQTNEAPHQSSGEAAPSPTPPRPSRTPAPRPPSSPGPFPPGHVPAVAALPRRSPSAPHRGSPSPFCFYLPARPRHPSLHAQPPHPGPGHLTHPAGATGLSEREKQGRKEPQAIASKPRPDEDPCGCLRSAWSGWRLSVENEKSAPLSRICVVFNLCAIQRYLIYTVVYFFLCECLRQKEQGLPIPEAFARAPLMAQALWTNPQGGRCGAGSEDGEVSRVGLRVVEFGKLDLGGLTPTHKKHSKLKNI